MLDVVTIPNVELMRVGKWDASTGPLTIERADLADAVAAYRAGIISAPVIKLGHEGPLRDGAPALGRVRTFAPRTAETSWWAISPTSHAASPH